MLGILAPQPADQRHGAQSDHQESDQQIDRQHRVQFESRGAFGPYAEIRKQPLSAGPQETEPGLDRRSIARLRGRHFIEDQRKVQRHNAPDQRHMLERSPDQFNKRGPIVVTHALAFSNSPVAGNWI